MRYLTVEEILLIHEYEIQRYGGLPGLKDITLLESACHRPQTSYGGLELYKTPFEKGAALIHAIIANHPFADGNKRTAMVAGLTFLNLNNYILRLTKKEFMDIALDTATKKLTIPNLANLLEKNCNAKGRT